MPLSVRLLFTGKLKKQKDSPNTAATKVVYEHVGDPDAADGEYVVLWAANEALL